MTENKKILASIEDICKTFNDKFIQKNCTLYNLTQQSSDLIKDTYRQILMNIINNKDSNESKELIKELSEIYIKHNIPYDTLYNELSYIQKSLLYFILEEKDSQKALNVLKFFDEMDSLITQSFLNSYLYSLLENNKLRLKTIRNSVQDEMIDFYEAHIIWVDKLIKAILHRDTNALPEKNHHNCHFGKWLDHDSVHNIISNMDDYLYIYEIHKTLHSISKEIDALLSSGTNDSQILLTYANQAENISKEIGIKLTTYSNELTIKKASRDPLTGVLNRELLNKLFTKEMDLHATTQNSLLFAVCDLDHFKKVNDTYWSCSRR